LRNLVDEKKTEIRSGIILMISETSGKVAAVAGVTDEYLDKISSVDLIRLVALKTGGKGGGGRPDLAQGGGVQPNKIEFAIKTAKSFIKEKLLEN
jgi:alanyl-tRNA synthetase